MDQKWNNAQATVIHGASHLPESLVEAMSFSAYPIVWWLNLAAFVGIFFLAIVVTLPLVLVSLPFFLWSKVSQKGKPQRSGHGLKARLPRDG